MDTGPKVLALWGAASLAMVGMLVLAAGSAASELGAGSGLRGVGLGVVGLALFSGYQVLQAERSPRGAARSCVAVGALTLLALLGVGASEGWLVVWALTGGAMLAAGCLHWRHLVVDAERADA